MTQVSVIIPAYNQAHYLNEAIRSVLNQTYQDFEVVVVDDGSTDDTCEIVHGFTDPRVCYIYQENSGLSAARNTGIRNTDSPLITFLDSDDLFLPEKLTLLIRALEDKPEIGFVAGKYIPIDEEGNRLKNESELKFTKEKTQLLLQNPICVGSVLVRRAWFEKTGFFDESLHAYEDWDMWLRLARTGCRMAWVEQPVYLYRFHEAQMTRESDRLCKASEAVLDKFFSDSDLSQDWKQMRDEAYRNHALRAAANAYRGGDYIHAKTHLIEATELDPDLCADGARTLAGRISAWADDPRTSDPLTFLKIVYNNLPDNLSMLHSRRRFFLARAAMRLAFESYQRDDYRETISAAWFAFCNQPSWMFNRGALSIFVRSCIYSKKSTNVKKTCQA